MKLHELGAQRQHEQAAVVLENQSGRHIDFGSLGPRRAAGMLDQISRLLNEHRRSPDSHRSENDPAYLQLLMMQQGLEARLQEAQMPMAIDVNSPAVQATIRKAETNPKALSPEEKDTMTAIALMKKESKRPGRLVKEQTELQQAQVVLAAQDMIDRVQGMLEDVSEMQFKDLPALADTIKNDMGMDQATQFQSQASAALTQLLQALQTGKIEMESAQGVLTGLEIQVPGSDLDQEPAAEPAAEPPEEEEVDLSLDANLDTDPAADQGALGRERR